MALSHRLLGWVRGDNRVYHCISIFKSSMEQLALDFPRSKVLVASFPLHWHSLLAQVTSK